VLRKLNEYSTTKWAIELFSSLKENTTLKLLDISDANISDDVCDTICEVLTVNKTLKDLWMHDNPITGQASQLILYVLWSCFLSYLSHPWQNIDKPLKQ